jgi:threonylcarbamoyladenosine tRNA methylthiotransferase MtaB
MSQLKTKVAFHTLGCKLNFSETSTISRSFPEDRYEKVGLNEKADVYVINTCSVTDAADRKCRQSITKILNQNPDAFIAVVGCYAQLKPEEISLIPGVDLVLGTNEKFDIATYIKSIEKKGTPEIHSCEITSAENYNFSFSMGDRTRSFLKIQDGCDYHCSYCTVPLARGKSRNQSINSIIKEVKEISAKGIKEIILTGVNTGDFGKSTGESLSDLLKELIRTDGIERFRISSIEPNLLTDDIIQLAYENEKILPHFHIPLQSGCNKILDLMRRRYRREVFSERVDSIKRLLPHAFIGVDVIVGFPGETDQEFDETYKFLLNLPVSFIHVFTFSERPGTPAYDMPGKVQSSIKEKRSKILINLAENKKTELYTHNIGNEANVLFEKTIKGGIITGFTGNYLKVEHRWKNNLSGEIKRVKLTGLSESGNMICELLN